MTAVIVPAKPLESALSRLSTVLDGPARTAIQQAMLIDVLCAAGDLTTTVTVVTADPTVAALATAYGAAVVEEGTPAGGIDAAVAQGIAATGGGRVLVVMGDLPLATGEDLDALVRAAPDHGVAIARSADGTGTNAMVLTPAGVVATSFGPGSLERHRAEARRRAVACVERTIDGLALDIDTPRDLADLLATGVDSHTLRMCDALDLRHRLAPEATG